MVNKLLKIWVSGLILFSLSVHGPRSTVHGQSKIILPKRTIADFERSPPGEFPKYFKSWPFQRGKAKAVYQVAEENGNRYLAARDNQNLSTQIFKEFHWKIESFPYLRWRWRARLLPAGAAENRGETNDSACGVYVVFGKMTGTALKYAWSTTLPEGMTFEKKPDKMVMKMLDSGKKNLGEWRTHCVHVPSEYKTLLGREMERGPTGFGILTDGNAVQKPAACDYDDFEILAVPCDRLE
ncbi:MAG: DUF3047 domain-containing protein [Deltaproteobacteria bacterium]|nr:DUF3047 domain-containing protein [Deltaproteobacteria bacterium]